MNDLNMNELSDSKHEIVVHFVDSEKIAWIYAGRYALFE